MFRRVLGHIRRQPVAFVALFFALGGGAMAANNYIRSTDTISEGDLAGSTYGSPVIASGKVTTGKLANGAVTNGKLANSSLSVNTDGSTLTGGGSITLGGSNSTPLGVASGGIDTAQLKDGSVTTGKFAPAAQAPDSAKLGGASPSDYGAVLSGRINGLTGAFDLEFGSPSGTSTASFTESSVSMLSPNHDLKARDLSVQLTTPPGNTSREFVLWINGAPSPIQLLHCTVDFTATTCTDSSHVADVPANSTMSFAEEGVGDAPADARIAFRLTNS